MQKKKHKAQCQLRKHRLTWGLSAKQLSKVLGIKSRSNYSRVENGKCPPPIGAAFACQVVFGVPVTEMFPDYYALIEDRVIGELAELHLALEKSTSPTAIRKQELCELALKRATPQSA